MTSRKVDQTFVLSPRNRDSAGSYLVINPLITLVLLFGAQIALSSSRNNNSESEEVLYR